MSATIVRDVDNLVRYVGPYKKSANTVIDSATEGTAVVTLQVYLEDVEMRTIVGTTRMREEIASGATTCTIPHFEVPFMATGDTISFHSDNGELNEGTVTYSAGTGVETEATNFDTLTFSATTGICAKGTVISMTKGVAAKTKFPVSFRSRALTTALEAIGVTIEIEPDDPTVTITSPFAASTLPITSVVATEDGSAAENQDIFSILNFSSATGSSAVSAGSRIRCKIGDDIAVTGEYGTAVAGNDDWGWEATIPDVLTQSAVIRSGDTLRLVVTLSGIAGFQDIESILARVVEK
jgi:hypothetical protein